MRLAFPYRRNLPALIGRVAGNVTRLWLNSSYPDSGDLGADRPDAAPPRRNPYAFQMADFALLANHAERPRSVGGFVEISPFSTASILGTRKRTVRNRPLRCQKAIIYHCPATLIYAHGREGVGY